MYYINARKKKPTLVIPMKISFSANLCPIQLLGPNPNTVMAKGCGLLELVFASVSRIHLSGKYFFGSGKNLSSIHIDGPLVITKVCEVIKM